MSSTLSLESKNLISSVPWQLVAFDLDDTLAPSKSALPAEVATQLKRLMELKQVAVISGGALPQFKLQLLDNLLLPQQLWGNLHLLPTCGTQYYKASPDEARPNTEAPINLEQIYALELSQAEKTKAINSLTARAKELGLWEEDVWGDRIEDRGSQITFSALGQAAPLSLKQGWDPTGRKRQSLASLVQQDLPELEVRSGGSTSVDITALGIDKSFGMRKLAAETGIDKQRILFVGDRLDPGGNDYPVLQDGWFTLPVTGWEETVLVIEELRKTHDLTNPFDPEQPGV